MRQIYWPTTAKNNGLSNTAKKDRQRLNMHTSCERNNLIIKLKKKKNDDNPAISDKKRSHTSLNGQFVYINFRLKVFVSASTQQQPAMPNS